ncbi:L,D-transpeptidase family protein [Streptomyces sp. AC495_CC817]|uniref:L,D-transpeptidase family protein n=1 Tax=Streptomyces sp. AC495_CC817 TaxID=2823900 RepID=UPI001C255D61|nr:L,D-transpeptidase family protein [Streptomyces sp. AC495_CC817]
MTDLISTPGAATENPGGVSAAGDAPTQVLPPRDGDQPLAWAPIEPTPKKRHLGLWIGIGAGVLALGAGAASMILIAPGTTVAGIPVGWMTPGIAADAISAHLAETEVTLTGAGEGTVLTGTDLGASLDAKALADEAFATHPMWNIGSWMGAPVPAKISLDADKAEAALRGAVPSSFDDPTDAAVSFDSATSTYIVTPAETGTGINVPDLTAAIADAVAKGGKSLEFSGDPTVAVAAVTDEDATAVATSLNTLLGTIGFYVGDERTVPVDAATAASWLKVVDDDEGTLRIEADEAAIQTVVDTLPGLVDRAPVNAATIVDSAGKVLREETTGVNGRALDDTSDIASDFAAQLESGDGVFALTVSETPFTAVTLLRRIEVDLSSQTAILYENDAVVKSWKISSGRSGTPTDQGHFKVYAHVRMQDMKGSNPDGTKYVTEDVPWVTYFNGDEAFHGTYWHSNFGRPMSHGCVNMPIDVAKYVYEWAPVGLEVWVHA